MSRKGKIPIAIPKGVEVKIAENKISVKGPKGTLHHELVPEIKVHIENNLIHVELNEAHSTAGNFHGLYRTIIDNMLSGASQGFEKKLEMIGVGYRAAVQGHLLDLQIGLSHPTKLHIPEGVHVRVDKNTSIVVTGADKQKLGQFAASVRAVRPPEPYQGKGIRYVGEYVRKKAGKAAAKK
jgi:large subunit ribosomal protein L6